MDPTGMITKVIKMGDIVQEGFNTLIHDRDSHVKVLVDIDASV